MATPSSQKGASGSPNRLPPEKPGAKGSDKSSTLSRKRDKTTGRFVSKKGQGLARKKVV